MMRAEDRIIHHLKDKVGLTGADSLVAQLKSQIRAESCRALPSRWGCANGPAGDLPMCVELEEHDEGDCPTVRVHPDDAEKFAAMVDRIHQRESDNARMRGALHEACEQIAERDDEIGKLSVGPSRAAVLREAVDELRNAADDTRVKEWRSGLRMGASRLDSMADAAERGDA